MRVLNVVDSLQLGGGIESFLMNVFRELDLTETRVEACFVGPKAGSMADEARRLGIDVWGCPLAFDNFRFMRGFRRELDARGPYDVVHTHLGHFGGAALTVARNLGVPRRLAHYHNTVEGHKNDWKRRLYVRWIRRMVLTSATGIVGCAWAALRYHLPRQWRDDPRMSVIRYGVPPERFAVPVDREAVRRELGLDARTPVIGHVGRFVWQKNQARLIDAARLVADKRPEVKFVLVGDGALLGEMMNHASALDLNANVLFTGLRRDVPRLLAAMDIFALPSLTEGHPVTLIEAQMAGLPVVASNIPSAIETVAEPFREYLRAPTDVRGLAESLLALLSRAAVEPGLRRAAREFGGQFTVKAAVRSMLAAWGAPDVAAPPDPCEWARSADVSAAAWGVARSR